MRALVIGGTGPTGPFVVNGLLERGYRVSLLNRGTREAPEIPRSVERIVGDPHFLETLREALGKRRFDLIVAMYGRMRHIAELAGEHAERLITIGGSPEFRGLWQPELLFPRGQQTPLPEDAPRVESEAEFRFGWLARISEDAVMAQHAAGRYHGVHLRYPLIYGPRQPMPTEWWVMRRILDGRRHIVLADGGLTLFVRGYSGNMAHAVLLAVDRPEIAGGKIYNCGDVRQFTIAQWVEAIGRAMGAELEVISVPAEYAYPARDLTIRPKHSHHHLFDLFKLRCELGYADKVEPLEALSRTVRWYLDNRPAETAEQRADYAVHYRTEDEMARIYADFRARLAAVEHVDRAFTHPYPHPAAPGMSRDQRGR
jgi:nucleoside-diphosphate-sugar epimerase